MNDASIAPESSINDALRPVSASQPCGPSLEYDHDYAMLLARIAPRDGAQYGTFVDRPGPPDWGEVERECQHLLRRTKDINLYVCLCRARARLARAEGLSDALRVLAEALRTWPDAVHPLPFVDGAPEPALRANALAALVDPEGLMADIGDIALVTAAPLRLSVRDVERAFHAQPRPAGASDAASVGRQLAALRESGPDHARRTLEHLADAAVQARAIDAWARARLGDDSPSLERLLRLLELFAGPVRSNAGGGRAVGEPGDAHTIRPWPWRADSMDKVPGRLADAPASTVAASGLAGAVAAPGEPIPTRSDMQRLIAEARQWFERHEPSSPVAVLLGRAERLVGLRFAQVAQIVPVDLLRQWDAEDAREAADAAGVEDGQGRNAAAKGGRR
jgi:type VI secretion system protein ImpA